MSLDTDLAAVNAATTAADRLAALSAWTNDATPIVDALHDQLATVTAQLQATRDALAASQDDLARAVAAIKRLLRARNAFPTVASPIAYDDS